MDNKIVIGLSGGVDSTMSAIDLKNAGYDVYGVNILMHDNCDCREAAALSAKEAGIPFYVEDVRQLFYDTVIKDLINEYTHGRTPNPCALCNFKVKFKTLCDFADRMGISKIATGHYANVVMSEKGRYAVSKAEDAKKDQSYFLWRLSQSQLSKMYFPLGSFEKTEVKLKAADRSLSSSQKKESQEICFLKESDYISFIRSADGYDANDQIKGDFTDVNGNKIGTHNGIINFTYGQRKGLGMSFGKPMFVVKIDAASNRVVLGENKDLFSDTFTVSELNYQSALLEENKMYRFKVKVRYAARPVGCEVTVKDGTARFSLEEPVRSITPGQSAVCYDDDRIVFGGVIDGVH